MIDRRIVFSLMIVSLALMLAGCSSSDGGKGAVGGGKSFIGGSEGLVITFMDEAPPAEVYDTSESTFDVSLRIENKGEADVNESKAEITISGINYQDFGKASAADMKQTINYALSGGRLNPQGKQIPGTVTNVDFSGFYYTGKLKGSAFFNIRADVCYQYESKATANLCVKQKLLGIPRDTDICEVSRDVTPENSGSPVHITEFSQSPVGSTKISFSFKIKHVGTGRIYDIDRKCEDRLSYQDKVKVVIDMGNLGNAVCPSLDNESKVKLFNQEKIVSCTIDFGVPENLGDFEKAANINLYYDYKKSIDRPLTVRHIDQE